MTRRYRRPLTVVRSLPARILTAAAMAIAGCGATDRAESASSPDSDAALIGLRIGDACELGRDGWLPEPIPIPPEVQAQIDAGLPVAINVPEGYQENPPIGAPYCTVKDEWPKPYFTAWCMTDRDCPTGAVCETGSEYCVAPCEDDDQCARPASCGKRMRGGPRYCRVSGGVFGAGDRDVGAADDCPEPCPRILTCCHGTCADLATDQYNCGHCGASCDNGAGYCQRGECVTPECSTACDAGTCCGTECCAEGQTCCDISGGNVIGSTCMDLPAGGSCPPPCYDCICAAPDTPIATPDGERPIAEIAVGDLVYSVDGDAIVAVPVARVGRKAAPPGHQMVRVTLASGAAVEMSPSHPTADGRTFADLASGDPLGEAEVLSAERVPYGHAFTHDILPASRTGAYFAAGALVGSTLRACP